MFTHHLTTCRLDYCFPGGAQRERVCRIPVVSTHIRRLRQIAGSRASSAVFRRLSQREDPLNSRPDSRKHSIKCSSKSSSQACSVFKSIQLSFGPSPKMKETRKMFKMSINCTQINQSYQSIISMSFSFSMHAQSRPKSIRRSVRKHVKPE